ncbi:hypothetical protein AK812_SmicGene33511 [Symbiodinium microadriaticum]|uniref:EF-hand domain-containing protein n=1 Tax=Symbiodinium microadriaticum TaxID=2951 RepID=A0A1Q9CRD3_SYMMI|nr:hypothetical protein AK812_SmicGene33511 [Symbiodinium microadriaticum]
MFDAEVISEELRKQFDAADKDGSGEVDAEEACRLFARSCDEAATDEEIHKTADALRRQLDTDRSGTISFDEYCFRFGRRYQMELNRRKRTGGVSDSNGVPKQDTATSKLDEEREKLEKEREAIRQERERLQLEKEREALRKEREALERERQASSGNSSSAQVLAPGMRVRIQGLRGAPELNGLEATTTEPMLAAGFVKAATTLASRVEVAVDVTVLPERDLVRRLHVRKDELKQLREADVQMASEVMLLGLFTWRPGSSDAGPLCLALGMGPGDDGEIVVKARPGRLPRRAPCQESALNSELLSNELPPEEHMDTNSMVDFNEDFRDIALRRCTKLQQLRKATVVRFDEAAGRYVVDIAEGRGQKSLKESNLVRLGAAQAGPGPGLGQKVTNLANSAFRGLQRGCAHVQVWLANSGYTWWQVLLGVAVVVLVVSAVMQAGSRHSGRRTPSSFQSRPDRADFSEDRTYRNERREEPAHHRRTARYEEDDLGYSDYDDSWSSGIGFGGMQKYLIIGGLAILCWKGIIPVQRMDWFQLYMLWNFLQSTGILGGHGGHYGGGFGRRRRSFF